MNTFKVTLVFSGEHNVDPDKKHGETVNFGAAGDTSADFFIRRFAVGLKAVLSQYRHTNLLSAVLHHSDEIHDDLLTGYRMIIEPVTVEAVAEEKAPEEPKIEETIVE